MRKVTLLVVLALAALGLWSILQRGRVAPRSPAPAPRAHPEVAIQDGKTIDFSSGQPVVKDSAAEKAALERAVKRMDAAAADVTFGPAATNTTSTGK